MALMTWPMTSDGAGAVTFTANEWRTLLTNLFTEGILGAASFEVTERAAGANMTLDIAAGVAVITGDDAAGQGRYLVRDDAADTEAVTIGTADPTNPRIDLVGIQLQDPSEGGSAGRNCIFAVVAGTAAGSPSAPAAPDSFLTLAQVAVAAAATSIVDANITDARTNATLVHDVLAAGYVDTTELADDAVTAAKIVANAVTTAKILDANVTEAKLATDVLSSAWTEVTYASGWTTGGADGLIYKKVGNIVYVQGLVSRSGSTTGSTTTIATLPTGYRPAATQNDFTNYYVASAGKVLSVSTAGVIQIAGVTSGDVYGIRLFFEAA